MSKMREASELRELEQRLSVVLDELAPRPSPAAMSRILGAVDAVPQRRGIGSWRIRSSELRFAQLSAVAAVVVLGAVVAAALLGLLPGPQQVGPSPVVSPSVAPSGAVRPSETPIETASPVAGGFTTGPATSPTEQWATLSWRQLAPGDPLSTIQSVVSWSGGWFALGDDVVSGTSGRTPVWWSTDGAAWIPLDPSEFGSRLIIGIVEGPSGLVALTGEPEAICRPSESDCDRWQPVPPVLSWTSTSGLDWAQHPGPLLSDLSRAGPDFVAGPAGLVVATTSGSSELAVSGDGVDWSVQPNALPDGYLALDLLGTQDGYLASGLIGVEEVFLWSSDGRVWSRIAGPTGALVSAIGRDGFIATGDPPPDGAVWHSNDGQEWRQLDGYPPDGAPQGQLYGDGTRMISDPIAETGLWTSLDGLAWQHLRVVGEFPAGGFVGAVFPGGILYGEESESGVRWWFAEASTGS